LAGKIKAFSILLVIISMVNIGTGCSRKPEQKPVSPPKTVGVSLVTKDEDFRKQFKKAMEENAQQEGIKLIWKESEPDKQEEDVKELLERKIKVLVIEFADETTAAAIAREAKTKDIPVLALGVMPQNVPLDGFIGIDPYRSGLQQSEFLSAALKELNPARVLIIKGLGHSVEEILLRGNLDGFQGRSNIQTTVQEVLPTEDVAARLAAMEELASYHGLIVHNPVWTEEVISLLDDLELAPNIVTVGIGATKQNIKAIMNGIHEAEIDLDPKLLGKYAYTGAKELAKEGQWQFEKQETSGSYDIPVKYVPANIISKDNIFLVEKRFEDLLGQQKEQDDNSNQGGHNSSSGGEEEGKQQNQNNKKSKVVIQTKEGKTMEIEVEGEVLKVEIQGGGGTQQKGSQGGNQQGSEGSQ
jgi:D-xylose transport system substrate-binding protein